MTNVRESERNVAGEPDDDPVLDRIVLVFLAIFLLAVVFTPSEWLLKWSMWWNGLH